ncbi:MAG: hypothetical protein LBV45_04280 [Xanthomonadaceae bacterium]|jgi:hypothetical protein|nr:hypothetical protein [Xanthomonadaceae bacterium]
MAMSEAVRSGKPDIVGRRAGAFLIEVMNEIDLCSEKWISECNAIAVMRWLYRWEATAR